MVEWSWFSLLSSSVFSFYNEYVLLQGKSGEISIFVWIYYSIKEEMKSPLNWFTVMNLYFNIKHRVPFCRLLLWVARDDVSGALAMLEEPAPVNVGNLFYKLRHKHGNWHMY